MENQLPKVSDCMNDMNMPTIIEVNTEIKMNLSANGFLDFMKKNSLYLDKTILIKDILDNKIGNNVILNFI